MNQFKLPDLGEGLAEAEIVRWHVAVGDQVAVDQPLLTVETAKAVVEVPSPRAGVIQKLYAKPGDIIATGAALVDYDSGTVVGRMPADAAELPANVAAASHTATSAAATGGLRAAPAARALAKRLNIAIETLTSSRDDGLITVDDVLTRLPARNSFTAPVQAPGEPLRGLRRAMSQSMAQARDEVMHCTLFDDADIESWSSTEDYTVRLLRAIAKGLQHEPSLNAWFDANSQTRHLLQQIDVAIAVDSATGLLTPVLRNVAGQSSIQLRTQVDKLKQAARERSIPSQDLRDFSFTLSNFGMLAGRYATPVIVPPAVAILAVGRWRKEAVVTENGIAARKRLPLSLSFDHRCVTGGEAARCLAALIADLELGS
jgi:2-oxoisovalerate dehydrogenase E2 component (dihydrolipoyl transacylase)